MKSKASLKRETVESETFHVGIELELKAPCENSEHDSEACDESYRENLESESNRDLLMNYLGLSRDAANSVEDYFNSDAFIDNLVQDHSCDNSDCPFNGKDPESTRTDIRSELLALTQNNSLKVVSDGSIKTDSDECDAEVCWNYFASKETIRDNAKILNKLKDMECKFDTSCGLHINLNNYLKVSKVNIPTETLSFLFNLVGKSRRSSSYCNRYAIAHDEKYSMIYHQGDRLEFRFFSPTLEASKLNAYVSMAHFIYKRLAGKKCFLPKKLRQYFLDKMIKVNGLEPIVAEMTLSQIESIGEINTLSRSRPVDAESDSEIESETETQNYFGTEERLSAQSA